MITQCIYQIEVGRHKPWVVRMKREVLECTCFHARYQPQEQQASRQGPYSVKHSNNFIRDGLAFYFILHLCSTAGRVMNLAAVSFQCFVFSWWSQWGLFMGSLFCLCVHVLVGGSICPSLTSAALALWSCSLCFSSLFSVLVWGLPSRNFRRSGRWWVAWVATTNACAEQVTHTTSTSSSVGNPNFFCTSLCTGCFCCCKVWAATLHLRSQAAICKIVCLHRPSTLHHLRVLGFGRCPSGWIKGSSGSQANEVDIIWLPPNTVFCWKALAEQKTTSWNPKIDFWMRETRLFIFVLSCLGCFWTARTWKAFYTSKPNMHGFCRTSKTSLSSNRIEHRSEWAEMGRKIEWPRSRQASPRHWQPL